MTITTLSKVRKFNFGQDNIWVKKKGLIRKLNILWVHFFDVLEDLFSITNFSFACFTIIKLKCHVIEFARLRRAHKLGSDFDKGYINFQQNCTVGNRSSESFFNSSLSLL